MISGETVVTRYLNNTSSETYTIPYGDYRTFDIDIDKACELISDKPISVTQVIKGQYSSGLKLFFM